MPNTNYGTRKEPPKELESIKAELHNATRGRINCSFEWYPDDGGTTTVMFHPAIGVNSFIGLFPNTAQAAALSGFLYEDRTLRTHGSATFVHPIIAGGADYKFMGIVIG